MNLEKLCTEMSNHQLPWTSWHFQRGKLVHTGLILFDLVQPRSCSFVDSYSRLFSLIMGRLIYWGPKQIFMGSSAGRISFWGPWTFSRLSPPRAILSFTPFLHKFNLCATSYSREWLIQIRPLILKNQLGPLWFAPTHSCMFCSWFNQI